MINYFRSKKSYHHEINELKKQLLDIDNQVTQRERNVYFAEKMTIISENENRILKLISDYEGRIITESARAADERELKMMEVIERKETRIKELELENIDLRTSYRNFREDVQEYEILTQTIETALKATTESTAQLAAKFAGISDKMKRLAGKFDKEHIKMVDGGKG